MLSNPSEIGSWGLTLVLHLYPTPVKLGAVLILKPPPHRKLTQGTYKLDVLLREGRDRWEAERGRAGVRDTGQPGLQEVTVIQMPGIRGEGKMGPRTEQRMAQ